MPYQPVRGASIFSHLGYEKNIFFEMNYQFFVQKSIIFLESHILFIDDVKDTNIV